ncbi:MAG: hypothetical protein NTZ84_01105 [Candidatus Nealsonbacteria bacterium]|nr:hypothetical protein [Candidatus Nealsonbacteria bacterium]
MDKTKKGLIVLTVLIILFVILAIFYSFLQPQGLAKTKNEIDGNVSVTKTTEIPTSEPTQVPSMVVNKSTACETGNISLLPRDGLDGLSLKKIAEKFSFFEKKDEVAEAIMRARIEGYIKGREVSTMNGTFKQMIFSLDGKIHSVCDVSISYPEEGFPFKAYLLIADDPKKLNEKIKIVFFYNEEDIVIAGWSKVLDTSFIVLYTEDSGGDDSSGGSDSGSDGGPVGDVGA